MIVTHGFNSMAVIHKWQMCRYRVRNNYTM
ncbi:CRISPR-associated DxTHG motif protein [Ectobacillus antri]